VLRNGTYTGAIGTPSSIVLVGHSFGSYTSNRVLTKYPTLIDAAIITGYVFPGDALSVQIFVEGTAPRIASHVSPHAFSHLDTGYLTFGDIFAHVNTFFKAPAYELDAAEYAHSIAQPYGIAELLSFGQDSVVAPAFAGPVLVTTGEYDFAMCRGECYSSFAGQRLESVFPKSRVLEAFVQPGAGHGVNFARNASGFYEGIGGFLGRAGF
jgi:pimeloyl-ACP methyl ester carboxylesterase